MTKWRLNSFVLLACVLACALLASAQDTPHAHGPLLHVGTNPASCTGPFDGKFNGNVRVHFYEDQKTLQISVEVHKAQKKTDYAIEIRCVGYLGTLTTDKHGDGVIAFSVPINDPPKRFYINVAVPTGGSGTGGYGDTFIAGPFDLSGD